MKSKAIFVISCIVLIIILLPACKSSNRDSKLENKDHESDPIKVMASELPTPTTITPTGDPKKDWIFVEQAVDAWLYFHLSDFKSYKPLRRSTDYDTIRHIYIHHLRYTTMNTQGGMITIDQDYEVDLNRPGDHSNPFFVKEN